MAATRSARTATTRTVVPRGRGSRLSRAPHTVGANPGLPAPGYEGGRPEDRSEGAASTQHGAVHDSLRRQAAADLLSRADAELLAAQLASDPAERFSHAHMAALRVAGAVLAVLGSRPPRGRTRSAWERLSADAEGFGPWAAFFASGAHLRSAVDAGRFDAVDESGAARWVAASEDFRDEVGRWVEDESAPLAGGLGTDGVPVSA